MGFCGRCGKPTAAGGKFCGACGAPSQTSGLPESQTQPSAPNGGPATAVAAKSGSSALKIILVVLAVGFGLVVLAAGGAVYFGKRKVDEWRRTHNAASVSDPSSVSGAPAAVTSRHRGDDFTLPTKEEIGAIIGEAVTSIEHSSATDVTYKTANLSIEAGLEIEREEDEAGAIQSIAAARKVTEHVFGGTGNAVTGLGDEAVYGAFNVLYVRRRDVVLTITPPRLQQAAQMAMNTKMMSEPMGSDAQVADLKQLQELMKGDPVANSMAKPDAVSGAVDLIKHAASESGNEYDRKARLMARQIAEKALANIGP